MKQKRAHKIVNRYSVGILVVLVVGLAVTATVIIKRNPAEAAATPPTDVAATSQFSFTGASDWWQGATNKTSMALFHSIRDSCFVSVQHKMGSIAADQAKRQQSDADLVRDGYTVTPGSTVMATIQTSDGSQPYTLVQSSVATPAGATKVLGGQEYGYLELANGYLFVEGHCETSDQLAATLPALQAVKFDNAN